ncbi:adenine deaminase C-terminal domain-containing protein [Thermoactinomyces mirandus]|uniref:adenine deaminase n=1 Tax=Thermoactinomyces mirandus TaxID=2756294 RepID=A0A7W1XPV0_9BACL|nr:adenine deaminase C-terminal domain-containing protein [Thermoactinomyces mirandus]MBA4601068.1 adenine deaminase [Thermoactinomyces mirandus]
MYIKTSKREQNLLIEVAMGKKTPSMLILGGTILNVYTGELEKADIALAGKRVVYVGPIEKSGLKLDEEIKTLDATGQVLVPGYIEPHAHPSQVYHPLTLAEKAGALGTTTLLCDNIAFFEQQDLSQVLNMMEQLKESPVKIFWWARLDAQATLPGERKRLFDFERVEEMIHYDRVVQTGELTDWHALLDGDDRMVAWITAARNEGKRVEGHVPGATCRTLSRLAAAGLTGDHESISFSDVWQRLKLGYMVTLRHSSIRPDLPRIMEELVQRKNVPWHRLMMTTDGATPLYFKKGFNDFLIRLAIQCGCPPVYAYQMVTINPAVYYRLDEHLGAIAPGRLADINFLTSLEEPSPARVIANGEVIAENGIYLPEKKMSRDCVYAGMDWDIATFEVKPEDLVIPDQGTRRFPVIHMVDSVITKRSKEKVESRDEKIYLPKDDERLFVFLIDRYGKWITPGLVRGFAREIDGLATTFTGSRDILVLGKDPQSMAKAANRVIQERGGIVWIQNGKVKYHLYLPILGLMKDDSIDDLIPQLEPLVQELEKYGFSFLDPLFTFCFLSSTHLPHIRLTSDGVIQVNRKKVEITSHQMVSIK